MISDLDILRAAQALFERHGKDAPKRAATRADALLKQGDFEGYMAWKRILEVVQELDRKSRSDETPS